MMDTSKTLRLDWLDGLEGERRFRIDRWAVDSNGTSLAIGLIEPPLALPECGVSDRVVLAGRHLGYPLTPESPLPLFVNLYCLARPLPESASVPSSELTQIAIGRLSES